MQIKKFINDVLNQIKYKPIKKEISNELEIHMQEIKNDYMNNGMESQEAEIRAVSQMGDAKKIGKILNKIHSPKLDWKLLIILFFLIVFGIITSILKQSLIDGYSYISKAIFYTTLGIILGICLYFLDYRKIKRYSNLLYIIATLVMFIPLINYNGDYSFKIFTIKFMPYILSMPLYIIAFVGYICNTKFSENKYTIKTIVLTITSLIMVSFISFINTLILATIYLILLIPKMNKDKKTLYFVWAIIFYLIITIIFTIFLNGELKLDSGLLFEVENDYTDVNIEELQNDILNNANLIGKANTERIYNSESLIYNQSQYTLIMFLERLGILPTLILILSIILMSIRIVIDIRKINENYGKLLVKGLGMLYIIQAIINIFMNFNIGIKVNVNLPFITYGATYFIVNICCISIILSIYRRKNIIFSNTKQKGFIKKLGQILITVDKKFD